MKWPWRRRLETRAGGYTDSILRLLTARASGVGMDVLALSGVEMAAGAYARAFGGCRVEGAAHVTDALTPSVLARIGRELITGGESLHVIETAGEGRVRLLPAASWTVEGDADPETWRFAVEVAGPDTTRQVRTEWPGVIFLAWSSHAARPHEGCGPLQCASATGKLAAVLEASLSNEHAGPVGNLVPIPAFDDSAEEDAPDDLRGLQAAVGKLAGGAFLAETTAAGWKGDRSEAPRSDWRPNRIGPAPTAETVALREQVVSDVLSLCGVPVAMFTAKDATASREAVRRFWIATVIPLLRALRAECAAKLEGEVQFTYDSYVLDMPGRSRVLTDLVTAGMSLADALKLAGLDDAGVIR